MPSNALLALPTAMTIAMSCGSNALTGSQPVDLSEPVHVEQLNALPAVPANSTNSITGTLSRETWDKLRESHDIANPDRVFWFLNEQIASLLIDTEPKIREYFEATKVTLELRSDPEGTDEVLLVSILTNLRWQEAEERLDQFDRDWWLSKTWFPSAKKICIDYQPA